MTSVSHSWTLPAIHASSWQSTDEIHSAATGLERYGSSRPRASQPATSPTAHNDMRGRSLSPSIAKTPSARNLLIIQVVTSTLQPMIETLRWLAIFIIAALRERRDLALENLALRQDRKSV